MARDDRPFLVRRSPIHGNGLIARTDLPSGMQLLEYKGRLLSHAEANAIYSASIETGHTFLFTLNADYLIDANVNGNAARWINHSCSPTCGAFTVPDPDGNPARERIYIETIKAVRAGTELTYNYEIRLAQPHTARLKKIWACCCGAKNCTGTLLQSKR